MAGVKFDDVNAPAAGAAGRQGGRCPSSNLVFSEWDRIFKDPMTTAAAVDRLVHHAVIIQMTGPSLRNEEALKRGATTTMKKLSNKETDGAV